MHDDIFGMFRSTEKGNDHMVCKILVALSPPLLLLLVHAPLSAQNTKVYVSVPSKSLTWFPAHLTKEKGFYRAEGLEVDFIIMKPQVALQALIGGDVGYTTALGSTMRAGVRGLPLRVVMTIADKPLFALIARPGINSVDELRGKLLGISSFGASSDTLARAVLRRYKMNLLIKTSRFSPWAAVPIVLLRWRPEPSMLRSSRHLTMLCWSVKAFVRFFSSAT
jgi:hypothetical protein